MTGPQRTRDYEGSRTQDTAESGKKKPPIDPPVTAQEMAQKPISEIATTFHELDREAVEASEQDELATALDEEEYDDEQSEEDPSGEQSEENGDTATDRGPEPSSPNAEQAESEEVDQDFIEQAVDIANGYEDRNEQTRLEYAMWVFETFFDGDIKSGSEKKDQRKKVKYAKFVDHKRLKTNPRRVSDLVRAAAVWTGFKARALELPNLTFSHCLELIAVEDEAVRTRFALEINQEQLSVRQTRKKISELNSRKVPKKLVDQLLLKIKDPRSLPVAEDYEKMIEDDEFISDELSKKERLLLRAEIDTKRDQISNCGQFLDLLEQRLADVDL